MGAPLLGAAQVIVYIGAISVLILFAIMLTQTKDAPSRLVFQTQAGPGGDRGGHHRDPDRARGQRHGLGRRRRSAIAARHRRTCADVLFERLRAPVRDRQRAAARRGRSAASSWPSASRAGRRERQPRRLPDPVGDPLRDRLVRVPRPAQRDQHADVHRADAQRRQPRDRRLRAFGRTGRRGAGRRSSR